jgi:signal peptidase I
MKPASRCRADAHAVKWELTCDALRRSRRLPFRVTGWSMFPTIWPGDTAFVEPVSAGDLSVGDIVLYEDGRQLVAHRVFKMINAPTGLMIQTRGDAVSVADTPVSVSHLLGRVSYIRGYGRWIDVSGTPGIFERAASSLFRSSRLVAWFIAGVHGLRQRFQPVFAGETAPIQIQDRAAFARIDH